MINQITLLFFSVSSNKFEILAKHVQRIMPVITYIYYEDFIIYYWQKIWEIDASEPFAFLH